MAVAGGALAKSMVWMYCSIPLLLWVCLSKSCRMAFINFLTTQKHLVNEEPEEQFRHCFSNFLKITLHFFVAEASMM
jgi:hypothetical protein